MEHAINTVNFQRLRNHAHTHTHTHTKAWGSEKRKASINLGEKVPLTLPRRTQCGRFVVVAVAAAVCPTAVAVTQICG